MNNTIKYYLSTILISCCSFSKISGQTNEIGVFLGGSLFHGDVGYDDDEYILLNSKPVMGFQFKRNFNYHFGVNISIYQGSISADDARSNDLFSLERNLHFKSKITELGFITEFNFRPYLSRDPEYNHTPFIFAGISRFFFNPTQQLNNNWYNLRPLGTEGQDTNLKRSTELYKLTGTSIPFGIGYKFNIYDFLTISVNMGWRITFTDYIDDVSTKYVDQNTLSELAVDLAADTDAVFVDGFQRGDPYTNDKYGFLGIAFIYSIKDPSQGCDIITY